MCFCYRSLTGGAMFLSSNMTVKNTKIIMFTVHSSGRVTVMSGR